MTIDVLINLLGDRCFSARLPKKFQDSFFIENMVDLKCISTTTSDFIFLSNIVYRNLISCIKLDFFQTAMLKKLSRGQWGYGYLNSSTKTYLGLWRTIMVLWKQRSCHQRCFIRKGDLRNFAKFAGKHLCNCPFFDKPATLLKERL